MRTGRRTVILALLTATVCAGCAGKEATLAHDPPTHIRPNEGDVERVNALLPLVQRAYPDMKVSKADVWRMALRRGFDSLVEQLVTEEAP